MYRRHLNSLSSGPPIAAWAEEFAARRLPELVRTLMRNGPPDAPMDIGI